MKLLRLAAVIGVAGFTLGVAPTNAVADDAPALSGFQGTAAASGIQVDYVPEGALPLPSLVDIGAPDAVATISSGPTTFAQASTIDPGDLLANPDALLTLFSSAYPSGTLPPYPFRIFANSGFGAPVAETNSPGLTARAEAQPTASAARSNTPQVDAKPVAFVGSMAATATTATDGKSVTVKAQSKLSGLSILGMLTIDSMVTDVSATSDGGEPKLSGGTKILGAEFNGQPVTIDRNGIRFAKSVLPLPKALGGSLNNALKAAGISITFSGPQEFDTPRAGQLSSAGLRIDFRFTSRSVSLLAKLFDALPPIDNPLPAPLPGPEDIVAALQANNVGDIVIGRGVVSLQTRSGGDTVDSSDDDFTDVLGSDADFGAGLGLGDLGLPGGGGLSPLPSIVTQKPVATSTSGSATQAGVGAFLLLALLAQPFFAKALSQFSNAVLATTGAEHCDSEEL